MWMVDGTDSDVHCCLTLCVLIFIDQSTYWSAQNWYPGIYLRTLFPWRKSTLEFERRLSGNTLKAYSHDLKEYIDFLYKNEKIRAVKNISYYNIKNYIKSLKFKENNDVKKINLSTINRYISCIRWCFNYSRAFNWRRWNYDSEYIKINSRQ